LTAAAGQRGLQLLVANHGGASSDPDILLARREEVGPEILGILLDVGNFEPITDVSLARILPAARSGSDFEDRAACNRCQDVGSRLGEAIGDSTVAMSFRSQATSH
jgi:hypothetical protein